MKRSSPYRAHQSRKRREKKDELAKKREQPCPRCNTKGGKGTIKVFGVRGKVEERPCPVCNFK